MKHAIARVPATKAAMIAVLCVAGMAASAVRAESIVLDQSAEAVGPYGGPAVSNMSPAWLCQTFTVGVGGELSQIGLQMYKSSGSTGAIFVELHPTVGGVPQTDIVAARTVPNSEIPLQPADWEDPLPVVMVDLADAAISVSPGDVLAIGLRTDEPNPGVPPWIIWADAEEYAGGGPFKYTFVGAESTWGYEAVPWTDVAFQNYVTVPEPGSLALLGVACLALLALARRPARRST